jgi:hypothetical protein
MSPTVFAGCIVTLSWPGSAEATILGVFLRGARATTHPARTKGKANQSRRLKLWGTGLRSVTITLPASHSFLKHSIVMVAFMMVRALNQPLRNLLGGQERSPFSCHPDKRGILFEHCKRDSVLRCHDRAAVAVGLCKGGYLIVIGVGQPINRRAKRD